MSLKLFQSINYLFCKPLETEVLRLFKKSALALRIKSLFYKFNLKPKIN
jgi:hypothetical protein